MTTRTSERLVTGGLDVGARSIKIAILSHEEKGSVVLAKAVVRIQGRRAEHADRTAIRQGWGRVLADAGLSAAEIDYVASTGMRDRQTVRVGRFYQRSSHAVGAGLLFSDATAALDIGADQIRCALLYEPPNGRRYAATRREAGGGAVAIFDPSARRTDVVLREATPALRDDLARDVLKLLRALGVDGKTVLTGGMALDADFVRSLWGHLLESGSNVSLLISPEAIFAGAYGAAILAARRYRRVSRTIDPTAADSPGPRILGTDRQMLN